ncbi:rskn-2, partial [Symbiodinium pilosum]
KGEVELYDYFYPFSPPPDESRPELKAYIARQKEGPDFTRLECSEDAKKLLTLLLTYDKEPRPSMQRVL